MDEPQMVFLRRAKKVFRAGSSFFTSLWRMAMARFSRPKAPPCKRVTPPVFPPSFLLFVITVGMCAWLALIEGVGLELSSKPGV